jgi:hypothetical protein
MEKFLLAALVGVIAGAVDVLPMALKKVPLITLAVPFTHWIAVALLTAYVQAPVPSWAKGILVALVTTIPVLIDYSQRKPESVLPILAISIGLGAVVGWATGRFAV